MKHSLQTAFKSWIGLTLLITASLVAIYFRNGTAGLNLFIQQWPLSNLVVTLAATAITWLLLGALLYMLINEKINAGNIFFVAGFFIVMLLYVNILRERFRYGDYAYYIEAATALLNNQTLPDTYLYLPLWATLLQFIVPLGDQGVLAILWTVNIFALGLFYVLLVRVLERYGYSNRLAVFITVLFMLVNTPLHRTLGYVQVNLLTMALIMFGILYFPKNVFLSALALALAIHLKTSPAALVLAFLLERNWRWMAWFALSFFVIAAIPVATNGFSPYYDFMHNISALTRIPSVSFHDTSFDSFLRFFNPYLGIHASWTRIMTYIAKALLGLGTILVMTLNVRNQSFINGKEQGNLMLNAIPPLFVLMTLASPLVWEHHGIFVTLSFLLILKRMDLPATWIWFGFAYFLEFVMPTFDFFPWSYGRLIAPMIILGLMWGIPKKQDGLRFFDSVNIWFVKPPI
ncbi:MAG: glycosyltransferase family 87 protein [Anaerolineales bacterium]|nr:glycosyltransferase family 87 protein [Anaerolineales bacterium]